MRFLGKAWKSLRTGRGAVFGALALFVLVSCILEGDKSAKRGSEVENEIHGVLVALDRGPVQGAKVKAVPVAGPVAKRGAAAADSDSVVTDEDGKYSLRGLEPGVYNLFGEYQDGDLVVLIPGVDHSDTTEPKDQGVDTLRAPGRIRGRLLLGARGKEGVIAYIPGTSFVSVSDDSGRFILTGIPQGTYPVRYTAPGYVIDPDSGVLVASGRMTELPDKHILHDPGYPPPAPEGLSATYDTLREQVTLRWEPALVSNLAGYQIYRDTLESTGLEPTLLENRLFVGTSHVDPVGPVGPAPVRVVYRMKSRNMRANTSGFSDPVIVTLVPSAAVRTLAAIRVPGKYAEGRATPGDSVLLIAEFRNPTRTLRAIQWDRQDAGGARIVVRSAGYATREGADTLLYFPAEVGNSLLSVAITDDGGMESRFQIVLDIVADPPAADAGRDTTVSIGDSVELSGSAGDRFGSVVKTEWDIGGTGVFAASGLDTAFAAPGAPAAAFPCILRVTDDDGFTGLDTLYVSVAEDKPLAFAGRDTLVSVGDRVLLRGAGSDRLGQVVRLEWKTGDGGEYEASPDGTLSFLAPMAPGALACILRVQDDDGNMSEDTLRVTVVEDAPIARGRGDTTVSILDDIRLKAEGADGFGRIVSFEWDVGGTGRFRKSSADTVVKAPANPVAAYPAILRVTDDDGGIGLDTVLIEVLLDAPVASAGRDTTVSVGDTVILKAAGSDRFGAVRSWDWDVGMTGAFRGVTAGDSSVRAPSQAGLFRCVARATDDDGVQALDTLTVTVVWDPPKAVAGAQLDSSFVGDTVRITSRNSSDGFGRIVKREWDIGGMGNFQPAPDGDMAVVLPSVTGPYPIGLRVTDDDGQTDEQRISIEVLETGVKTWIRTAAFGEPIEYSPSATVFNNQIWMYVDSVLMHSEDGFIWTTRKAPFHSWSPTLVSFQGKIFFFGVETIERNGSIRIKSNVWSSSDGFTWTKTVDSLPFTGLHGSRSLEFNGRLWILLNKGGNFGAWSSANGTDWVEEASFGSINTEELAATIHQGKIWIVTDGKAWSTSDGRNWTQAIGNIPPDMHARGTLVSYGGKLWLWGIPITAIQSMDLWSSSDGATWTRSAKTPEFGIRVFHAGLTFKDRIWFLQKTDVWMTR